MDIPSPSIIFQMHLNGWITAYNEMEIKQLKSYINTAYFTPWDYEVENQSPLPVDNRQSARKDTKEVRKNKKGGFFARQAVDSVEEQAKKTLLSIEPVPKQQQVERLKDYIDSKMLQHKYESVFPLGIKDLKLPPITRPQPTLQYSNSNSLIMNKQATQRVGDKEDIFKKYGGHHKSSPKDSKVERSVSFGSGVNNKLNEIVELRRKYETLDHSRQSLISIKKLKLKGKRFSMDSRIAEGSSNRTEGESSFTPSQPNITPHYVLFGHTKEDVLKKVLQQIQHKIK